MILGSFATATCMVCKHKVTSSEVKEEIMQQVVHSLDLDFHVV